MSPSHRLVLAAALTAASLSAQAALVDRGGGMIYDDVQHITWLQNWNTNGLMNWTTANDWANNLVYGGFDDWRLPTANTTASSNCASSFYPGSPYPQQYFGDNCTGSEMGYMFYNYLGGKAAQSVLNQAGDTPQEIANLALFTNVQASTYWSGTDYAPNPGYAWYFRTYDGFQRFDAKSYSGLYAVAVRAGDVAATVPEPQTLALALLALGAGAVVARRRPR